MSAKGKNEDFGSIWPDAFGNINPTADPNIDHKYFVKDEIQKNANGDVVKIVRTYNDGVDTTFSKRFVPENGDEVVATTYTIYPWTKN